jgi:hypothetical protein
MDMFAMFYKATQFNQCISSWPHDVANDVGLSAMFQGTDCPNQNPTEAGVGPWCQTVAEMCI